MTSGQNNPKVDIPGSAEKDPDEWVSGDDPMTASQASYLKTLSEQADDPDAYLDGLSKAEASKRIEELRAKPNLPGAIIEYLEQKARRQNEGVSETARSSAGGHLVVEKSWEHQGLPVVREQDAPF